MPDNALVQVRIDPRIRDKASEVLARSGLTVSDAARILLTRIANENVVPPELLATDAGYDEWFRAKVQEALDDPRPDIEEDEAERMMAAKRRELRETVAKAS
jgi:DNA-damage-inducible protein J